MIVQISAGQGPAECSIGVEKLCDSLMKEFENGKVLSVNRDYSGYGYRSAILEFDSDISFLEGTILWICKSPVRSEHKRKNWFMDLSILKEPQNDITLDMKDVRFETMHCGGKGGQHVNKVETGVRLRHIPTGITIECTEERSQFQNKSRAVKKLEAVLEAVNEESVRNSVKDARKKHTGITRGNPIRTYEGMDFRLRK